VLRLGLIFLTLLAAIAFANAVSTTTPLRGDHNTLEVRLSDAMALIQSGSMSEALEVLDELSVAQYAPAEAQLGLMYANGLGVERNQPIAAIWFYRAARQGLPSAQLALGAILAEGRGVPSDIEDAYMWIKLAQTRSEGRISERAAEMAGIVKKSLSAEEVAAAEGRVRSWKPSRPLPINSRY